MWEDATMALMYPCPSCGGNILVRYLTEGEPAVCKNCGAENPVPSTAEVVDDKSTELPDPQLAVSEVDATIEEAEVTVPCSSCKQEYTVSNYDSLITDTSTDDMMEMKTTCPICHVEHTIVARDLGCPACRKNYRVYIGLDGHGIDCPHCGALISLPTEAERSDFAAGKDYEWRVVPTGNEEEITSNGLSDVVARITDGTFGPNDDCAVHESAPWRKLRDVCDEYFDVRKLYDPVGASSERAGNIIGVTLCVLYLVAHVVYGAMVMGSAYIVAAVCGILAVVLTPTIIGLIIVYVVAKAFGIPLLGAYIGVILVALTAALVFWIGCGVGRGVMGMIARATDLEAKRVVMWQ
jgi:DNA-directed RNA polymerase subunit M/transcription elongation factor TFIIS